MIGFPAPGAASALAERMALPVFLPPPAPKDATPWAFLSWGSIPLHGLSQSLRQRPLDRRHLSWGFAPLQRFRRRESTSVRLPGSAPRWCRDPPTGPTLSTTVSLAGFSNLSATFFLSPPPRHFQAGYARGVCPSGVCSFHEAPATRRPRPALVTFLPRVALPPFLGGGSRGHTVRLPRIARRGAFDRLQGLRPRGNRSASPSHV